MELAAVLRVIADEKEHFVREIEQGILQHDLYKSTAALGGKDACDRILRALSVLLRRRRRRLLSEHEGLSRIAPARRVSRNGGRDS
jgi:hypothetical protein